MNWAAHEGRTPTPSIGSRKGYVLDQELVKKIGDRHLATSQFLVVFAQELGASPHFSTSSESRGDQGGKVSPWSPFYEV